MKLVSDNRVSRWNQDNNLAHRWKGQQRDKEAVALMKERVQLRERVLGPDHPSTLSLRETLTEWEVEGLE